MSPRQVALCLVLLTGWAIADPVSEPPTAWVVRIAPVATQRLDDLDAASADRIRATRRHITAQLLATAVDDDKLAASYGRLGGLYATHRMYAGAEAALGNARRLDPNGFQWVYYLAHIALEQGEPAQALTLLDAAATLDADHPALALRRGEALLGLNRLDGARAAYARASDTPQLRTAAEYGLAQVDLLQREWAAAARRLQAVLDAQPEASAARYGLGQALIRLGRRDEARNQLERSGRSKPAYPDRLVDELRALQRGARFQFENAIDAVEQQDYSAAIAAFEAGLGEAPGNARARISYARALWLNGQLDAAEQQLQRANLDAPQETLAQFLLGVIADANDDSALAAEHYRNTLAIDPAHQGALSYLASLMLRSGDPTTAAIRYRQAIDAGATDMPVFLHYWSALHQAGTKADVLRDRLSEFDARFPEPPVFRYLLARLLLSTADTAMRDPQTGLQIAHELNNANPSPTHAGLLAYALAATGDFEQAGRVQQRLVELARAMGAWMQIDALQVTAMEYQAGRLPDPPFETSDPPPLPPPVDADLVMRNYPAGQAY